MIPLKINFYFFILLLFIGLEGCRQTNKTNDHLILFADTIHDGYGYKNPNGDIIIPAGKYEICYTDTFRNYAIVLKPKSGFVAIDRQEKELYKVFPFDNGPDPAEEGLFRIVKDNKIGFADARSGQIVIDPQFDCAFPFQNSIAKVSKDCKSESDGEHITWLSNNWY